MSSSHPDLYAYPTRRARFVSRRTSLRARLLVVLRRGALDEMLAGGADPAARPELALRAAQLTSRRYRRSLADRLEEVVHVAERPGPRLSAAPPVARRSVIAARAALLELSTTLREAETVSASGVALAQRLLTDGTGPVYVGEDEDTLWHATRRASAAL